MKKVNNWELIDVTFKPDVSLSESYGSIEILVNDNTYSFEEVEFPSDADEIELDLIAEAFGDEMDEEDFASLSEEILQEIADICTKDLKSW